MAKKNLFVLLNEMVEVVDADVVALEQQLAENNDTLDVHYFTWLEMIKHAYQADRTLNLVAEMGDLLIEYGMDPRTIDKLFENHNVKEIMCPDGECFTELEDDYTLFEDDPVQDFEDLLSRTFKKGDINDEE
jgi:Holliday junction resolvasome RuvABC endonuclease subunit